MTLGSPLESPGELRQLAPVREPACDLVGVAMAIGGLFIPTSALPSCQGVDRSEYNNGGDDGQGDDLFHSAYLWPAPLIFFAGQTCGLSCAGRSWPPPLLAALPWRPRLSRDDPTKPFFRSHEIGVKPGCGPIVAD